MYAWFQENYGGLRKTAYSAVKHGRIAGEKCVEGFLAMLLAGSPPYPQPDVLKRARLVLLDFLRERGIQTLSQVPRESIIAHIAGPLTLEKPGRASTRDYLRSSIVAIAEGVSPNFPVNRYVQGCGSDDDVIQAIRWMYVCAGHCIGADGSRMSATEATELAEQHLQQSMEEYRTRASKWQQFNPWTVVFAQDGSRRVGMSIVLPLSQAAYTEILDGKRVSYEMTPSDLESPSTRLLIEACAECPPEDRPHNVNPTTPLKMTLALQCAALSRARELPRECDVRLLSFAGTPRNRDRLVDTGFIPTGRTMYRTGVELFERVMPLRTSKLQPALEAQFLRFFSELCDRPPPT